MKKNLKTIEDLLNYKVETNKKSEQNGQAESLITFFETLNNNIFKGVSRKTLGILLSHFFYKNKLDENVVFNKELPNLNPSPNINYFLLFNILCINILGGLNEKNFFWDSNNDDSNIAHDLISKDFNGTKIDSEEEKTKEFVRIYPLYNCLNLRIIF